MYMYISLVPSRQVKSREHDCTISLYRKHRTVLNRKKLHVYFEGKFGLIFAHPASIYVRVHLTSKYSRYTVVSIMSRDFTLDN